MILLTRKIAHTVDCSVVFANGAREFDSTPLSSCKLRGTDETGDAVEVLECDARVEWD